ncbi:MAG: WYL domain-containing protein [Actinomycetota bacterium]
MLDDYETGLASPSGWTPQRRGPGRPRRAAVRISPEGRRVAAVMGLLQPLRVRRTVEPDIDGWVEATFRVSSIERSARDVLPLGAEVEVLRPPSLRTRVATMSSMTAALYRD